MLFAEPRDPRGNTPERIRTCNLRFRRRTLEPPEIQENLSQCLILRYIEVLCKVSHADPCLYWELRYWLM
jgi:hypothetical protein